MSGLLVIYALLSWTRPGASYKGADTAIASPPTRRASERDLARCHDRCTACRVRCYQHRTSARRRDRGGRTGWMGVRSARSEIETAAIFGDTAKMLHPVFQTVLTPAVKREVQDGTSKAHARAPRRGRS